MFVLEPGTGIELKFRDILFATFFSLSFFFGLASSLKFSGLGSLPDSLLLFSSFSVGTPVLVVPEVSVTESVEVGNLSGLLRATQVEESSRVTVVPLAFELLQGHLYLVVLISINDGRFADLLADDNLRYGVVHHLIISTLHPDIPTVGESIGQSVLKLVTVFLDERVHDRLPFFDDGDILLD